MPASLKQTRERCEHDAPSPLLQVELAWRTAKLATATKGTDPTVVAAKQQLLAEAVLDYVHFAGRM